MRRTISIMAMLACFALPLLLLNSGRSPAAEPAGPPAPAASSDSQTDDTASAPASRPALADPPAAGYSTQEAATRTAIQTDAPPTDAPILDNTSRQVSFQALLKDASGNPLVGPVNLEFQLYTSPGGVVVGAAIPVLNVPVSNGIVDTQVPIPNTSFDGTGRELGVRVNGGAELTPRMKLTAVPHAYRVDRVASEELDDSIDLGSNSANGYLGVFSAASDVRSIELAGTNHRISTYGSDGLEQTRLYGPSWGELWLFDEVDNTNTATLSAGCEGGILNCFLNPTGGWLSLRSNSGANGVYVNGQAATASFYGADGTLGVLVDGQDATVEAEDALRVVQTVNGSVRGELVTHSGGAYLRTYDENNAQTAIIGSSGSTGGFCELRTGSGQVGLRLDGDDSGAGLLVIRDSSGVAKITLDGNVSGDGRITTQELQVTGGSDLSEQFDVAPAGRVQAAPGTVVCIDAERPGKLRVSSAAYDRTVAGVISGAGGLKPGMMMGQQNTEADGKHAVALTGRVYVLCDANQGAIQPGDLLTTSTTPGHAMKVSDHTRGQGAILGKAMSPLAAGRGLVLVLVTLQ